MAYDGLECMYGVCIRYRIDISNRKRTNEWMNEWTPLRMDGVIKCICTGTHINREFIRNVHWSRHLLSFDENRSASKYKFEEKKNNECFFSFSYLSGFGKSKCIAAQCTPHHMPFWRFSVWYTSSHIVSLHFISLRYSILLNLPCYYYQFGVYLLKAFSGYDLIRF